MLLTHPRDCEEPAKTEARHPTDSKEESRETINVEKNRSACTFTMDPACLIRIRTSETDVSVEAPVFYRYTRKVKVKARRIDAREAELEAIVVDLGLRSGDFHDMIMRPVKPRAPRKPMSAKKNVTISPLANSRGLKRHSLGAKG